MYLLENPVLQRELVGNLRMVRAFILLCAYLALLGAVVLVAWPQEKQLDLTTNPVAARRLVNLFFLGQYLLAALMTPSFAAGAITGEKERKSFEMLLASPLRPGAIVLGKLLASLAHLAVLVFASLPIVMLCLPLGGVSIYEVLAAYLALILSVLTFGMISLAASSFFQRTVAALLVSYLAILPLALCGVAFWSSLESVGLARLLVAVTVLPVVCGTIFVVLFLKTTARLMYPSDIGSEGKQVVDLEEETRRAVGLVIHRDRFPDRLFAPAKRNTLLADGANPVFDKEMRSEIFSQGTLMLRVVIQVSMLLAIPLMAIWLYIWPQQIPWYIGYVLLFNMLVGPVFSAGSITGERERDTLDLLLTTTLSPWQILWAKLLSGLRVSIVLTLLLMWPVLLAFVLAMIFQLLRPPQFFWDNWLAVVAELAIVLTSALTTANLALFCSVLFRRTAVSLMTSYLLIALLYTMPVATLLFAQTFFPASRATRIARAASVISPLATAFSVPLEMTGEERASATNLFGVSATTPASHSPPEPQQPAAGTAAETPHATSSTSSLPASAAPPANPATWDHLAAYVLTYLLVNIALLAAMVWLFDRRWRVAE